MYSVGKSECFVSVYQLSFKAYVTSKFLCANNHSIEEKRGKNTGSQMTWVYSHVIDLAQFTKVRFVILT